IIDRHALEGITAADVVARLHVSRSLADLRFREVTGTSILEAILNRRLAEVKRMLGGTDMRISEIAVRCGYRDANYLKNLFRKRFGLSMREFRARMRQLHNKPASAVF
ncbi:MAG: helix-turn-helix transcriptional regulator, partial [Kiritimatiellae bacterium]|nr:helix-turn-helix transcriptional regulator [Kiritimatiellia bacterium]